MSSCPEAWKLWEDTPSIQPQPKPRYESGMTKRTPQLETAILQAFAEGLTITKACSANGLSRTAFNKWKHADPDLARRYAEMQADHAEALVEQAMEIAEDPTSKWASGRCGDDRPHDGDHIRHARLRIDTRLRIARIHLRCHEAFMLRLARAEEQELRDQAEADAEPQAPRKPKTEKPQFTDYTAVMDENYRRLIAGEPTLRPNPHRDANGKLLVPLKSQRSAV